MPKITDGRIEFTPADRYFIKEQSPGITAEQFASLFNDAADQGNTSPYYKFLEEITEKDPDIQQAVASRTSEITSKEWSIEGPDETVAADLERALKAIPGDVAQGLMTVDQLINSFLGSSYLTGISMNEIVTDEEQIIGFNHIPSHFLTFEGTVYYPELKTQDNPTGVPFNQEKMIAHYLNPGEDVVRGWLGHSLGWQYVFKTGNLDQQLQWQQKYGKGFLLVNMPGDKDSYEQAWQAAEDLVDNLYTVDGGVFPAEVEAEFVSPDNMQGEYFFDANDEYKSNIVKIILGQTSTSDTTDSNRSTASVHQDTLEARVLQDIENIEDTINKQLLNKVGQLANISNIDEYSFKFQISELEQEEAIIEEETSE